MPARLSIIVLAVAATVVCAIAVASFEFRWIDVAVYRWGGEAVLEASNLYAVRDPELGMPFTYTPFAALVFWVLAPVQLLTPTAWTLLSLAALARASWLLARERHGWLSALPTVWPALAIAAGVLATQPGTQTMRLGQVGFVLLWLVCEDLLGRPRRSSGVLVGVATALKLTPGAYILLLFAVGRVRAAVLAGAVVLATIAGAWLVVPEESATFWRHLGPDVSTIGPVTAVDHWSLNGTIWRIAGDGGSPLVWLPLAAVTLAATLVLARVWWRADRPAGAIGLVALGSVLASPFSWSHHWVAVAPLFVALLAEATNARRARMVRGAIGTSYALLLTGVWWHGPRAVLRAPLDDHTADALAVNSYLLVGAILLTLAWTLRPAPRAVSVPAHERPALVATT